MNQDRRRGGWVSTLLALVVLVVVGFLCGALAGFLWEEPGLVLAYLSGETESVEWSEPGPVAAEPPPFADSAEQDREAPAATRGIDAAAEMPRETSPESTVAALGVTEFVPEVAAAPPAKPTPPEVPEAAPRKPKTAPAPAAKPPAPRVAAVAPGRFSIQVGAFGDSAAAENLAARLRARGYKSYVKTDEAGGSRWRVRVGPVDGRAQAEDLAAKLQKGEKLPTWILDEGAG